MVNDLARLLVPGTWDTLYMIFLSVFFSHLFGVPLGILLEVTGPGHVAENKWIHLILGFVTNMGRSIPFIILLVAIVPLTKKIAGTTIGPTAATIPLTMAAIPFVGRMVEQSLKEIP